MPWTWFYVFVWHPIFRHQTSSLWVHLSACGSFEKTIRNCCYNQTKSSNDDLGKSNTNVILERNSKGMRVFNTSRNKPLFLWRIFVSVISDSFSPPAKCKLLRDYFHLALSYIHLYVWKSINRQIIQYIIQANKLSRSVVWSFDRTVARTLIRSFG